jgi:hypothetical protein
VDGGKEVRAVVYESAKDLMSRAHDVAGVCREIVMRTAMTIDKKKYVKVEGWQSMATAFGCSPSIKEVAEVDGGVKATAELRRHDGTVLASAEGFCGDDEPRWANQPMYARRGMAQTRAISRVCRSVFAFVVVLIDENLSTTPAEEIPMGGGEVVDPPVSRPTRSSAKVDRASSPKVPYGKNKGKHLCDIDDEDLKWVFGAAQKSADANDPKWGKANKEFLAKVQAEVTRRSFGLESEATGKIEAPAQTAPRTVREEPTEEAIVTPFMRLSQLAKKHGLSMAQMAGRAKGATGKDGGFTHEDINRVTDALEGVAQ